MLTSEVEESAMNKHRFSHKLNAANCSTLEGQITMNSSSMNVCGEKNS